MGKGGPNMNEILARVSESQYLENKFMTNEYWSQRIQKQFSKNHIDDMTDLNYATCFTYLVSLNQNNEGLYSDDIETVLEEKDAYFYEILISSQKPLITAHFWRYPKGSQAQVLEVSEKPYLKEHGLAYNKMLDFIKDNNLVFLNDNDLKSKVNFDGILASLYYKFFNQEGEDPLKIPY